MLLDWTLPSNMKKTVVTGVASDELKIAYPAPTVGRKGAYELRAAVQGLGIRLVTGFLDEPRLSGHRCHPRSSYLPSNKG